MKKFKAINLILSIILLAQVVLPIFTNLEFSQVEAALTAVNQSQTFGYTGGVQTFKASVTGEYEITLYGAQGGSCKYPASGASAAGGQGSIKTATIKLNKNESISITIGGKGSDGTAPISNGGIGGDTSITRSGSVILNATGGNGATYTPIYHTHIGNSSTYGGCYTTQAICGKTLKQYGELIGPYYWSGDNTTYCPSCGGNFCNRGTLC